MAGKKGFCTAGPARYHAAMWKRILRLFRGPKPIIVPGSEGLCEGEGRTVTLGDPMNDGLQVLLCRVDGQVHALDTECPHGEGGRLVRGPLVAGRLAVCPLHNYRFDVTSGEPVGVACRRARRLRVAEKDGEFQLWP